MFSSFASTRKRFLPRQAIYIILVFKAIPSETRLLAPNHLQRPGWSPAIPLCSDRQRKRSQIQMPAHPHLGRELSWTPAAESSRWQEKGAPISHQLPPTLFLWVCYSAMPCGHHWSLGTLNYRPQRQQARVPSPAALQPRRQLETHTVKLGHRILHG